MVTVAGKIEKRQEVRTASPARDINENKPDGSVLRCYGKDGDMLNPRWAESQKYYLPDREVRSSISSRPSSNGNRKLEVLPLHQLLGALGRAHHGFDQRHAQAAFFQFHQSVDSAARGGGDHVLQLGRMLAG